MASRTPSSRPIPSKPIIFSIPLEIRQCILSYAFCEAVAQDIAFNDKLQKEVPRPEFGAGLYLSTIDDLDDFDTENEAWPGAKTLKTSRRPPCAPRIYAMANKISEVHPQLKEEVQFVFKQCLQQFRS